MNTTLNSEFILEQQEIINKLIAQTSDDINTDFTEVLFANSATYYSQQSTENEIIIGNDSPQQLIDGRGGDDLIIGRDGSDLLYGGGGKDFLFGNTGVDFLFGDLDNDLLSGDEGDDILDGGLGNDILKGGSGNDLLLDLSGNNTLLGDLGNDLLRAGEGRDSLKGGAGDDTLIGASAFATQGIDILEGGDGSDTFVLGEENIVFYRDGGYADIRDFNPDEDTIQLAGNKSDYQLISNDSGGNSIIYQPDNNQEAVTIAKINDTSSALTLDSNAFDFVTSTNTSKPDSELTNAQQIAVEQAKSEVPGGINVDFTEELFTDSTAFYGSEQNEIIVGSERPQVLNGQDGEDLILGGDGFDFLFGGEGNDFLFGEQDEDSLFGNEGNDFLYGGENDDNLDGGLGNDNLDGGEGDDSLLDEYGDNILVGSLGNDVLVSGNGQDSLYGGTGNDTLSGASASGTQGIDILHGGDGNDTFILGDEENNVFYRDGGYADIRDFNAHEDIIQLAGNKSDYQLISNESGGNSIIYQPDNNEEAVTIANINDTSSTLNLDSNAFQFV